MIKLNEGKLYKTCLHKICNYEIGDNLARYFMVNLCQNNVNNHLCRANLQFEMNIQYYDHIISFCTNRIFHLEQGLHGWGRHMWPYIARTINEVPLGVKWVVETWNLYYQICFIIIFTVSFFYRSKTSFLTRTSKGCLRIPVRMSNE